MWICLLTFLLAPPQAPEPTIDASSEATLNRSLAAISERLPAARRKKVEDALMILTMVWTPTQSAQTGHTLDAFKVVNGKTAEDVVALAETKVREMIAAEAKRKVISGAFPASKPATAKALACEALVSTVIGPARPPEADLFQISPSSLLKPKADLPAVGTVLLEAESQVGTDRVAIEIDGPRLKLITRANADTGTASTEPLDVIQNDDKALLATAHDRGPLGLDFNMFVLNKGNGLAIWSQTSSRFLMFEQPRVDSVYLRCR